jgi:ribosomal protein S18 acetylase RimI-like enzyme
MPISFHKNKCSVVVLSEFLCENDEAFSPPLSSQVGAIPEYAEKVKSKAVVFEAYDNGAILVGIVAIYLNDKNSGNGFVTSVVVAGSYQGMGIGSRLLINAISCAREHGFCKVSLEVHNENSKAISWYSQHGFAHKDASDIHEDFLIMELSL